MNFLLRIFARLGFGREALSAAGTAPPPILPPAPALPSVGQVAPSSAGIVVQAVGDPPTAAPLLVSPALVASLFPKATQPEEWAGALSTAMARRNITTISRAASFLGQVGHESGGLVRLVESMDYDAARLRFIFETSRISAAEADRLGRKPGRPAQQEALANVLYGGAWGDKNLGNVELGDGWRFRGRGLIQLTGRDNYARAAAALGKPLDDLPAWLETRRGAAESAAWWWEWQGCNRLSDAGDYDGITKRINPGMVAAADRRGQRIMAEAALLTQAQRAQRV